jgi:hypothetical protein
MGSSIVNSQTQNSVQEDFFGIECSYEMEQKTLPEIVTSDETCSHHSEQETK